MKILNGKNLSWKIITIILLIAAVIFGVKFLSSPEDAWLCQNGEWVKYGNPITAKPLDGCQKPSNGSNATTTPQAEVEILTPTANQTVKSPLRVAGKARGSWYFEASFPIKLVDSQNREVAISHVQSIGDWMTSNFVPFSGELKFNVSATTTGELILQNDNPSGLPQNSKEIRIPVIISPEPAFSVKAYFNNDKLDPEVSCNKVFPVERQIAKTVSVARAALEELLAGPDELDKALNYTTSINQGVIIKSLTITGGIARVDFNDKLEFQTGGSCRVTAIRSQITQTLKQFSAIKDVIISIDGRTEDILQP